jgi:hypothetical protein
MLPGLLQQSGILEVAAFGVMDGDMDRRSPAGGRSWSEDHLGGVPAGGGDDLGGALRDREFGEHEGGSQQGC